MMETPEFKQYHENSLKGWKKALKHGKKDHYDVEIPGFKGLSRKEKEIL
jgi:hypothetical protein